MNYYNEFDPKAAAWLRELINEDLIPNGEIDTRSITDVRPNDLRGFDQCHFFAGIGGWPYALRLAGWPTIKPVWTGSCPCQPFSCAGKQLGEADERHLWPAFYRLIDAIRPPCVFGEQVASKAALSWIDGVFTDLEGAGYACAANDLCAASIGAPHIRQRLYWVAISKQHGWGTRSTPESRQAGGSALTDNGGIESGMADTTSLPWAQHEREQGFGLWRITGPQNSSERRSDNEKLANSKSGGQRTDGDAELRRSEHCDQSKWTVQQPDASGRMGNADHSGQFQQCWAESVQPEQPSAELRGNSGFWSSAIWHACRDGKARRISPEPALFPLAYGLPGRVGLLRGAGNAIVAQVTAEFIRAAVEAMNDCD